MNKYQLTQVRDALGYWNANYPNLSITRDALAILDAELSKGESEPVLWADSIDLDSDPDFITNAQKKDGALGASYFTIPLFAQPQAQPDVESANAQDAARYRWLRENSHMEIRYRQYKRKKWFAVCNPLGNYDYDYDDTLDAAVDAAMKGEA